MDKIDKILTSVLSDKGLLGTARSAQICFLADRWANGQFQSISFSKGILKVSVQSSPAASELQMKEEKLIDHLNGKIGKKVVRSIRILMTK